MQRRTLLLGTLALPTIAQAQGAWPNRPVRILNPYAPGGTSDIIVRPIAERLQQKLGQPFIIDNRTGAGGTIATAAGAQAAADGYTLLVTNTGPLAVAPSLFPNLAYDPTRAFAWIAMFGGAPIVCAVKADGPIRTLADYATAAKAAPDAVSFGSSGIGSAGHLTGVLFGMEAQAQMLHVPFRGAADAQQSVLGGNTTSLWDTAAGNAEAIRSGLLRGLAVSTAQRAAALPDVPSVAELGFPGVVSTNWFLLAAPVGIDPAIAQRLRTAILETLAEQAIRDRLNNATIVSLGDMDPTAIARFVETEKDRWGRVVRAGNVRPA